MSIFKKIIVPFTGTEDLSLDMTLDDTKQYLKDCEIKYRVDYVSNKGCTPEVPWNIIRIEDKISLYYANNKMFKIVFKEGYEGKTENGIYVGMPVSEAKTIDTSLKYDEENEDYASDLGYWIEDNLENGEISSITVFIKELLNEDVFFLYEWIKK